MEQSPFKFGEVVTDQYFTNREDEILNLHSNFNSLQNTIIISPRRYGKSSLVKEAANRYNERQYIFCFIDLMYIFSEEEFYNHFATKILQASSNKLEEFLHSAKNILKGAKVAVNTGTGEPTVELGLSFIQENLEAILNLPQEIARKKRKKIIICIDEFQNIARFENDLQIQGRLRALWQHHDRVGYIIYGSKQSMMMNFFNKANNPFYRFGEIIYLKRISSEKLKTYIQEAFRSTKKEISDEICEQIIQTVENHPYYTQQFARNIWLRAGRKVLDADFATAKHALISENQNFYNEVLDELTTYQFGYLKAILNNEKYLYSSKVINTYKLGSSANVRRMYKGFVKKGILIKEANEIFFTDPIFKLILSERI